MRYNWTIRVLIISSFVGSCQTGGVEGDTTPPRSYYLNSTGSDTNPGTRERPFLTLEKLNGLHLNPGDTIYLESGQSINGNLRLDSSDVGEPDRPIVITSTGAGKATLSAGNSSAITINKSANLIVRNLHFVGSGRKEGNTQSGLVIQNSTHISADSLEIEGFQKSGLMVYSSSNIIVEKIHAHDNGAAGITVSGENKKSDSRDIVIRHCLAENNPGDPTQLDNHSGNGIIVGLCSNVLIEFCVATNNGWDMPRKGNGPVGIWTYESDSVVIQHCISYRNKTSEGGEDGGGFDLDGGVTNSVIQYCLSYENEGAGFGIFQYNGASAWKNNIVRFNISKNDGLVSRAHAGLFIWNGSDDGKTLSDFYFYNNVIYNERGTAIYFDEHSSHERFMYYNNIFLTGGNLVRGKPNNDVFAGNNWWSGSGNFSAEFKSFKEWIVNSKQEQINGVMRGMNIDPGFTNNPSKLTDPLSITTFVGYEIPLNSPLHSGGVDLQSELGIDNGGKTFNGQSPPAKGIGASFRIR